MFILHILDSDRPEVELLNDDRLDALPRARLAHLPTPIEEMPRLSAALGGPRLFVKRDDCTGLATGGNKTRKLEFLLGDAQAKGADTLVTDGGLQSNHCRQTAAAAARTGMDCVLVLQRGFSDEETGNLLLDRILGAQVVLIDATANRADAVAEAVAGLERTGRTPYIITTGGSDGVGAMGYANAIREINTQSAELGLGFDAILTASGSGGTQGGLLVGKKLFDQPAQIVGISDGEPVEELTKMILGVASDAERVLGRSLGLSSDDVCIFDEYYGQGYGIPTPEMVEAVHLVARSEGILLDPVYSGKAMAGLLDLVRRGYFKPTQNLLFLHTGGTPALFAYREALAINQSGRNSRTDIVR